MMGVMFSRKARRPQVHSDSLATLPPLLLDWESLGDLAGYVSQNVQSAFGPIDWQSTIDGAPLATSLDVRDARARERASFAMIGTLHDPHPEWGGQVSVYFSVDMASGVVTAESSPQPYPMSLRKPIVDAVLDWFLAEGTPVGLLDQVRARWAWILPVAAVVAWVVVTAQTAPIIAAHVLFAVALAALVLVCRDVSAKAVDRVTRSIGGIRFRAESRAETARRRADRHADRRVFLITASSTLLITLIGAFATAYFAGWFPSGR